MAPALIRQLQQAASVYEASTYIMSMGKPALQLWDYRPGKLEMGSIARSENERETRTALRQFNINTHAPLNNG